MVMSHWTSETISDYSTLLGGGGTHWRWRADRIGGRTETRWLHGGIAHKQEFCLVSRLIEDLNINLELSVLVMFFFPPD